MRSGIKKHYKGLADRFIIMYLPFVSSLFYVIHTLMLMDKVESSLFYGYNSNLFGHSIFWLYLILVRSKNMCKWYKLSIMSSMLMNVLNVLYYHNIIGWLSFLDLLLVLSIISILSWLIFRITYKTSKAIHSACKHSEIE